MTTFEMALAATAVLMALVALGFWVAMVVHCCTSRELTTEHRLLWLLVLILGKLVGALVYYFLRYRRGTSAPAVLASS